MKLYKITVMSMDENIYIYYDDKVNEGVIIDPGGNTNEILDFVKKQNIKIKGILLTHGHGDHISSVPSLKNAFACPVVCHEDERDTLENAELNLSSMISGTLEISPDITLKDSDVFTFGEKSRLKLIHTPGHTKGGACFYDEDEKLLFTGDTLFFSSIGRTDFPTVLRSKLNGKKESSAENMQALVENIKKKLFVLPDDTEVYPGHGRKTKIGFEKNNNPFCL